MLTTTAAIQIMLASQKAILVPLFAQVLLTFLLMVLMAYKRVQAATARRYTVRDIAVDSGKYPGDLIKFGNSFGNQFELPTLFYLLCVLLLVSGKGQLGLYTLLASLFVATRYVHAVIHVTSNHVIRRFYAFLAGAVILVTMWGLFVFDVLV